MPPMPLNAPPPTPPPSGRAPVVIGVVTLVAPLVALLLKLPTAGLLTFMIVTFGGIVLAAGYVVLVFAVAVGMLPQTGSLRTRRERRHAMAWALVTSVGIVVLGLTMLDADQGVSRSTLTWMLGAIGNESPAHAVSAGIAQGALAAWLVGYALLVLTWAFARSPSTVRGEGQVAAPGEAVAVDERPSRAGSTER